MLTVPATNTSEDATVRSTDVDKTTFKSAVRGAPDGYIVEAAIPIELITDQQGKDWHSFQFTLVAQDVDDPQESPCGVAWRGTQAFRKSNRNFGHFVNAD